MYVDLETGTILGGPIVYLDHLPAHVRGDSEIMEYASCHGRACLPSGEEG